jgi:hypothetical protein
MQKLLLLAVVSCKKNCITSHQNSGLPPVVSTPLRVRKSILGNMRKHLAGYVTIEKRNIFLHVVQTGSWAHTFYEYFAMDTEGSFPWW